MAIYSVFSSNLAHSGIEKDCEDGARGKATGKGGGCKGETERQKVMRFRSPGCTVTPSDNEQGYGLMVVTI